MTPFDLPRIPSYKTLQPTALAIRPRMYGPMIKTNPNLLRALLRGYHDELAQVDQAILEIRRQIGEAQRPASQATPDRRQLSTKVMKRIASARRWRRTGYKKRKPNPSASRVQLLSRIHPVRIPSRGAPHALLNWPPL